MIEDNSALAIDKSHSEAEDAVVVSGLRAIGTGLYGLGIPKDSILQYETAFKSGSFVASADRTADEPFRAREIIKRTKSEAMEEPGNSDHSAAGERQWLGDT